MHLILKKGTMIPQFDFYLTTWQVLKKNLYVGIF